MFPDEFCIAFSSSENVAEILIEIALILCITLGNLGILMMLIRLVQEYGKYLLMSSVLNVS